MIYVLYMHVYIWYIYSNSRLNYVSNEDPASIPYIGILISNVIYFLQFFIKCIIKYIIEVS